jgi:hypothetical protein
VSIEKRHDGRENVEQPNWLTAANYLDSPWCYVVAAGVIAVAVALLSVLDRAHKKVLAKA